MAISQSGASCMDQWRELFSNAGVDIFDIIQRSIKIAASDRPNEFKNMRGEIAELLFACKYVQHSDDNNLGTVEHKDSLDGGMDVKEKMVGFDQGTEESCLNEWEGLACPPLDDFLFSYAQPSSTEFDLTTFFDGIDDDCNVESGEVYNKKKKEETPKKRKGKQLKLIMEAKIEKQSMALNAIKEKAPKSQRGKELKPVDDVSKKRSTGLKPIKHPGSVEKRLNIPATSGAPKRGLSRQQHGPRVLVEETSQKKLGVTKRKFEEQIGISKQMKMQRRTNVMHDDLLSQPGVSTEKTYRP